MITGTALGVSRDVIARNLMARSDSSRAARRTTSARFAALRAAPVRSVWDESMARSGTRIVCKLEPDADPEVAEEWIRTTWPVTVEVDCRLPRTPEQAPADLDRGDGSGLRQLSDLLGTT